jgi:thiol:disulfide interchange protein DsbD
MLVWLRLFFFTFLAGLQCLYGTLDDHPALLAAAETNPVQIELLNEEESVQSGRPFWLAVRMNIGEEWHTYWKNPGDAGMPISIEWELPPGFEAGPIEWPYPSRFDLNSLIGYGYEGEVFLLVRIVPPKNYSGNQAVTLRANVKWLVCNDSTCLPGLTSSEIKLAITDLEPKLHFDHAGHFMKARSLLPKKQWGLQARRMGELVEVRVQPPAGFDRNLTHAYFCPEFRKQIDHKTEAILTQLEEPTHPYVLVLKSDATAKQKSLNLKGVFVFTCGYGKSPCLEAVDADIPIQENSSSLEQIGLADPVPSVRKEMQHQNPIPVVVPLESHQEYEGEFLWILVLAFVGGMILNLMPCVLPVLSIKILGCVKMAGESRRENLKHGLAYSFGVILSFWVLAGILMLLQIYGHSRGWGFQFQEPVFVGIFAAVLWVLGLSMFGIFEIGTSVTALAGHAQSTASNGNKLLSSFSSGVLATALATPCTGPLLGPALGIALILPPLQALLIFTSLGLGMAFPYLLLSAYPSLLRILPKPGAWMITLKEIMGFLMMATVLWLVQVFGAQTNFQALFVLLCALFFVALSCWIYGKWSGPMRKLPVRLVSYVFASSFLLFGGFLIVKTASSTPGGNFDGNSSSIAMIGSDERGPVWENFSPSRVEDLQKQGIPVLVDFTAQWCLICQANHFILTTSEVSSMLDQAGVVRMKADWTRNDPVITQELKRYGRSGVPLYLLYGKDSSQTPQVLPQVLSPGVIKDALLQIGMTEISQSKGPL